MKNFGSLVLVLVLVLMITGAGCDKSTSDKSPPGADAHTKAELIDQLLRGLDEKGKFNGVVLVSEHSKVIYKKRLWVCKL